MTTQFEYDDLDRLIRTTDPALNQQERIYDENGSLKETRRRFWLEDTSEYTPGESISVRTYDEADRLVEERDVFGNLTKRDYDEAGNLIRLTRPTGESVRYEYDAMNRRTAVIDENGYRWETKYDLAGNPIATVDPTGRRTTNEYDASGQLTMVTDAAGITQFDYDGNGRLTETIDANAVLDPTLLNSEGASVSQKYDELGRLVEVRNALDQVTTMTYDLLGNRTSVKDAEGHETTFEYDGLGRLEVVKDPLIQDEPGIGDRVTTHEYDEAGNRIYSRFRDGTEEEVDYDLLNRPTTATLLGTVEQRNWTYDQHERLESVGNADVTYGFQYDLKDRLTLRTDSRSPGQGIVYQYDGSDRLLRKTDYQGDVTDFQYDGTGRLSSESNAEYLQVSYQYDGAGRVLTRSLSNGARTAYRYDAAGRLEELTNWTGDGTLLQRIRYDVRDPVGNPKQITITHADGSVEVATFDYNALHQLEEAVYTVGGVEQERQNFTYDAVGNRKTKTSTLGALPIQHYIYNDNNQLTEIRLGSATGSLHRSFEYDANGRLRIRRNGAGVAEFELDRDARGRVRRAEVSDVEVARYRYDPLGYRIEVDRLPGVERRLLDGEHLEAIRSDTGGVLSKFLRGSVIDEVVNAYYFDANGKPANYTYHHDSLQSVVGLSGHAGSVEETLRYGPFGEVLGQTGSSRSALRFTGRDFDAETGLYYYRARYYDPEIGRFLSEDPLGLNGGDVNLYAYVGNNPLRFNDPSGEVVQVLVGAVIGFGTSLATELVLNGGDLSQVNVGAVIGGTAAGALTGGLSALSASVIRGSATAATVSLLGAGGAGIAGNAVSRAFNDLPPFDPVQTPAAAAIGLIGGGTSLLVGASAAPALEIGATTPFKVELLSAAAAFEVSLPFEVGASQLLVGEQSVAIGPLDDFNPTFDFPSANVSDPLFDVYCSPKCF